MKWFLLLPLLVAVSAAAGPREGNNSDEQQALQYMAWFEENKPLMMKESALAEWDYSTNITDANEKKKLDTTVKSSKFDKAANVNITSFAWRSFHDPDLRRKFKLLSYPGRAALTEQDFTTLHADINKMESIYSKSKICIFGTDLKSCNASLNLDPEITNIMAKSRDYDQLSYVWQQWHEVVGRPIRKLYPEYIELSNRAAKLNGFKDNSEMWLKEYESETFASEVEKLWQTVKPFYQQLHAYVRRKLMAVYKDKIRADGPIPAHLLGNMWAQSWEHVEPLVKPFPQKASVNATPEMIKQGYNALKMFQVSEEFFTSIGLFAVPPSFWNLSMIVRPADGRPVVCHASAWEFYDRHDVRIKMCTKVNTEDLITIHHELGHIQYYLQYKDQSIVYRDGANPGFHEAVGDTLALSAGTAAHLKKIHLLPDYVDDEEGNLNSLMSMALGKIAFLPFGYIMDMYRWKIFRGEITPENYNAKWWELRRDYQGIEPPVPRSEVDFDAGAKYHVAADVEYLRYFVSFIIQFQFHRSLCEEAGQYVHGDPTRPLHKCDIYQNKAAGKLFSDMLKLGSSRPWPEAMSVIMKGKMKTMDATALVEYFQPLMDYLIKENEKNKEYIGWRDAGHPGTTTHAPAPASASLLASSSILLCLAGVVKYLLA